MSWQGAPGGECGRIGGSRKGSCAEKVVPGMTSTSSRNLWSRFDLIITYSSYWTIKVQSGIIGHLAQAFQEARQQAERPILRRAEATGGAPEAWTGRQVEVVRPKSPERVRVMDLAGTARQLQLRVALCRRTGRSLWTCLRSGDPTVDGDGCAALGAGFCNTPWGDATRLRRTLPRSPGAGGSGSLHGLPRTPASGASVTGACCTARR